MRHSHIITSFIASLARYIYHVIPLLVYMPKSNSVLRGVGIQIFKKTLQMKFYPVLHCRQVKVHRKINFGSLVTTMYKKVFGGRRGPQSKDFFFTVNNRQEVNFLTFCIKLRKYKGIQTLV